MGSPYNAGRSITVSQIVPMPVKDLDFGEITITENWGRLFIACGGREIVIERNAYKKFIAAISEFIDPSTKPAKEPV